MVRDKKIFVFSTSGSDNLKYNKTIKDCLAANHGTLIGEYASKGYDTYGIFKWMGGISKGHPNDKDISNAINSVKPFK